MRHDRAALWCYRRGYDLSLYEAWAQMRSRCFNPNHRAYKNYGGRGIGICKRWDRFENFAADMGPHPGKGWSLDRKNNDKGYSKSNCRWATRKEQIRNRRTTKLTAARVNALRKIPYTRGLHAALGRRYGVSIATISKVRAGVIWV